MQTRYCATLIAFRNGGAMEKQHYSIKQATTQTNATIPEYSTYTAAFDEAVHIKRQSKAAMVSRVVEMPIGIVRLVWGPVYLFYVHSIRLQWMLIGK